MTRLARAILAVAEHRHRVGPESRAHSISQVEATIRAMALRRSQQERERDLATPSAERMFAGKPATREWSPSPALLRDTSVGLSKTLWWVLAACAIVIAAIYFYYA